MRLYLSLFAFVPVVLMYAVNGPGVVDYVFNTLLLMAAGISFATTAAQHGSLQSELDIQRQYLHEVRDADANEDHTGIWQAWYSNRLYNASRL